MRFAPLARPFMGAGKAVLYQTAYIEEKEGDRGKSARVKGSAVKLARGGCLCVDADEL